MIAARMKVVQRDRLDACLHGGKAPTPSASPAPTRSKGRKAAPPPVPREEKAEDYEKAPDIGAPVDITPQQNAVPSAPPPTDEGTSNNQ